MTWVVEETGGYGDRIKKFCLATPRASATLYVYGLSVDVFFFY